MYEQVEKPKTNTSVAGHNSVAQRKSNVEPMIGFADKHHVAVAQSKLREIGIGSSKITRPSVSQPVVNTHTRGTPSQLQPITENKPRLITFRQGEQLAQRVNFEDVDLKTLENSKETEGGKFATFASTLQHKLTTSKGLKLSRGVRAYQELLNDASASTAREIAAEGMLYGLLNDAVAYIQQKTGEPGSPASKKVRPENGKIAQAQKIVIACKELLGIADVDEKEISIADIVKHTHNIDLEMRTLTTLIRNIHSTPYKTVLNQWIIDLSTLYNKILSLVTRITASTSEQIVIRLDASIARRRAEALGGDVHASAGGFVGMTVPVGKINGLVHGEREARAEARIKQNNEQIKLLELLGSTLGVNIASVKSEIDRR